MNNISVGVDWGSSSFRAYRFDDSGSLLDAFESKAGIKTVERGEFEQTLFANVGQWLSPGDTVLLSGMITSRNGWTETPYLPAPLQFTDLLKVAVDLNLKNEVKAQFLPGVCMGSTDVMRGEELQLYGAIPDDDSVVVLPGTHSKWASIRSGILEDFCTIVTGEIFDLLLNHSLVGGLAVGEGFREDSFKAGVEYGYSHSNIITRLFTARSSVLLGSLQAIDVHSYLSGLLIGNEIREAGDMVKQTPLLLVGDASLVHKYKTALSVLSIEACISEDRAAARGFQKLIKQSVRQE